MFETDEPALVEEAVTAAPETSAAPSEATLYVRHFAEAHKKAEGWGHLTVVLALLLVAGIIALILLLGSHWLVKAYVAVLLVVALWGAYRLRKTLAVLEESLWHAGKFALKLKGQPSREEFLAAVQAEVTPNDQSNVPEAIQQLANGSVMGDTIHHAARYAFKAPMTELGFAGFVRAVLVLAGLFGTVLFFAVELSGDAFLGGADLGSLMGGLRGALASTLTGLAGSVFISLVASNIARHVETSMSEFEAFLSALVVPLLAKRRARPNAKSEQDLWESLRLEVEHMTESTAGAFERMSNDAATHVEALDRVSRRLDALPQVQWPENFDALRHSLENFSHSAEVLSRVLPRLIDTAASLQVYAPAKLLHDVANLDATVRAQQEDLHRVSTSVGQFSATFSSKLNAVQSAADQVTAAATAVEAEQQNARQRLDALEQSTTQQLNTLRESTGQQLDALQQSTTQQLHTAQQRTEHQFNDLGAQIRETNQSAQQADLFFQQTRAEVGALRRDVQDLRGTGDLLKRVQNQLGSMELLLGWHQRASRAPLMQMLLAPLWRSWFRGSSRSVS